MINWIDKKNTYIDETVIIEDGTTIYPNVILEGNTKIGKNCTIHMGSYIIDSIIGDDTIIQNSQIVKSIIGKKNTIGPYAYIRPNNEIGDENRIGFAVELKNSKIGNHNKIPHLSYIGDSIIGNDVNIGCGVITANYDGIEKHLTEIQDNAFIGCNANLIAPLIIEKNSVVAAGSTVTEDVPENALAIARNRQTNKPNYNKKNLT